ncbi:hypothetical protein IscW_ISCW015207 [Ixodes scapularis]|uniref:Uncharacterized protein n=1 Tax=Ixodes scapularis TaxID=6945 RepID=B7QNY9_IXOSC|nr:hypothetical protein IscW_ISCW015207 [Ixodes scapularis]|eukprot:XP_002416643.1 hypothetical protein IscW_ISCW015207 [Ixodes scapularis]
MRLPVVLTRDPTYTHTHQPSAGRDDLARAEGQARWMSRKARACLGLSSDRLPHPGPAASGLAPRSEQVERRLSFLTVPALSHPQFVEGALQQQQKCSVTMLVIFVRS